MRWTEGQSHGCAADERTDERMNGAALYARDRLVLESESSDDRGGDDGHGGRQSRSSTATGRTAAGRGVGDDDGRSHRSLVSGHTTFEVVSAGSRELNGQSAVNAQIGLLDRGSGRGRGIARVGRLNKVGRANIPVDKAAGVDGDRRGAIVSDPFEGAIDRAGREFAERVVPGTAGVGADNLRRTFQELSQQRNEVGGFSHGARGSRVDTVRRERVHDLADERVPHGGGDFRAEGLVDRGHIGGRGRGRGNIAASHGVFEEVVQSVDQIGALGGVGVEVGTTGTGSSIEERLLVALVEDTDDDRGRIVFAVQSAVNDGLNEAGFTGRIRSAEQSDRIALTEGSRIVHAGGRDAGDSN